MAWLEAQLYFLGFTLLHFLKRPFRLLRDQDRDFLESYGPEGLWPLNQVDKSWLLKFSQCLNCNYCDSACPVLGEKKRENFLGPSFVVNSLTRSPPDYWASDLDFSLCEACEQCENACPNKIPVKGAIEFIEAQLANRRSQES